MFLSGAPLTVAIVQIPLRFQIVNGMETLRASVRLLPFIVIVPFGSVVTAAASGRKIPLVYLFIGGSLLQVVGFSLLSTLPIDGNVDTAQYGYQIIAGFAVGSCIASMTLMAPLAVEKGDKCEFPSLIGKCMILTVYSCDRRSSATIPLDGWCDRTRRCDHGAKRLYQITSPE